MLYLCSHYYSLLFCSPSFPFSLRFLFCLPFHSFTLFSFCDYVILCDRMSCKCTAACGCVQLRVVACGCVWLRVAACGCVWCASYPKKNAKNATNTIFLFEKNEWFSPKQPPPPKK